MAEVAHSTVQIQALLASKSKPGSLILDFDMQQTSLLGSEPSLINTPLYEGKCEAGRGWQMGMRD
ncbi:UNVERIFIED_CONTAM: hypothetical protein Sradi_4550100 [Sesamum radiatum]|uniref:Uncharacterized protein n=1 Tax=Sesamum radiatum TaxID=300843 RepID=A0AAW2NB32_SESRA